MQYKYQKRGILLVFIILALVLLVFTALIFVSLTKVETTSVINFIKKRKSLFLSESGFYYAATKLLVDMKNSNILNNDWQFMGEDVNRNGQLDPDEDKNKNGVLDTIEVPLDNSASVSYPFRKDGKGEILNYYWSYPGLSVEEEFYIIKLKISDESSKININYGNPSDPNDASSNNLKRILNVLGSELGISSLGDRIISARPSSGFTQLEELINTVITYGEFERLKYYITTFSYGTLLLKYYNHSPGTGTFKEGMPIFAISDIFPKRVEMEKRYFININTAPYAVLVAVLTDLSGYHIDGTATEGFSGVALSTNKTNVKNGKYTPVPIGILRKTKPITVDQAKNIANAIIQRRIKQPFTNFYGENGWESFLEELLNKKVIDFYQKEVLRANFNPNVNSFLWNPDQPFRFLIDKFMLATTSFEWTFLPTGCFTIESIGEIFTKDKIVSKTYTKKLVKLWDVTFLSTQEDFVGSSFEYIDKSLQKANIKHPTRLGYELDIYPFMYPYEKKASNFTGYIGLSTISLPSEMLTLTYKKNNKESKLKPANLVTFNKGIEIDEPKDSKLKLLKSEELPFIFTDGAFSDTNKAVRLGAIKSPKFDTTVVDPNQKPPVAGGESYPVPVSIGFFKGNLTIPSDKLLGFLEELEIRPEDIFTGMSLGSLAGVSIKDLKNKRLTLFLPHSCCFWDIYWTGGGGGIHFFVPKHAEDLIMKYFPPDVISALEELCANEEIMNIFGARLGTRALECPLSGTTRFYSYGIYFWHKGNWINRNAIYPLVSFGRYFPEKEYGVNQSAIGAEPPEPDEQTKLEEILKLYRKKSKYHSAMIQDFYFALSFLDHGKLFKKNKITMYLDLATPNRNIITDEKNPSYYNYKYLTSYTLSDNDFMLEEGKWNHLGLFFSVKFKREEEKIKRDDKEETIYITRPKLVKTGIFKNNDGVKSKTRYLIGDLQNLRDTGEDGLRNISYIGENIASFENPGIRFGEYIKRGYAKIDRPIFDPYLYGFATSQSTYDEIYVYKFDEESIEERIPYKISEILYKAGRYYPSGGTFTLLNNSWKRFITGHSFISNQIYYYIPPALRNTCSIDNSFTIKGEKLNLEKHAENIFTSSKRIEVNNINSINIAINCRTTPPLLETPLIDTIIIFTYSGIEEVISATEIRDISY